MIEEEESFVKISSKEEFLNKYSDEDRHEFFTKLANRKLINN